MTVSYFSLFQSKHARTYTHTHTHTHSLSLSLFLSHAVTHLVEALRHKKEGPGIHSQCCHCKLFILNFRRVLNAVCFLLGNSPAYEILYADVPEHSVPSYRRVRMKNFLQTCLCRWNRPCSQLPTRSTKHCNVSLTQCVRPHCGPGVDLASTRNIFWW